jgi:transmembrane sensor
MSRWTNWLTRTSPGSRWFARIRTASLSEREDKAFVSWLEKSPRNAQRYDDQELAWGLALELADRPEISRLIDEALREAAPRARRVARPRLIAAACSIALAVAAALLVEMNRTSTAGYATRVGEQRAIKLEDGSTVTLNTATEIHVRYARRSRSIELIRGEALFAVQPDAGRPFTVLALGDVTTAVGTEFAVELSPSSAAVSVLEGTVSVGPPSPGTVPARVGAGQAVDYAPGAAPGPPHGADTDRIRAWQASRILFSDKRLEDAVAEYNRYTTTPIVLDAPGLADRKVHGIFRIGDEDAFIHALERGLPLHARRDAHGITLVPR